MLSSWISQEADIVSRCEFVMLIVVMERLGCLWLSSDTFIRDLHVAASLLDTMFREHVRLETARRDLHLQSNVEL